MTRSSVVARRAVPRSQALGLAGAAFALSATALHAALPTAPDMSGRTSTDGQLLIASPDMRDPFDHAVILMAQHNRDGAFGIVINHPAGSRPIAEVLKAIGSDASGVTSNVLMFLGGPVSPEIAFVLHSDRLSPPRHDRHRRPRRAHRRPRKSCAISVSAKGRARASSPSAMPAGRRRSSTTRSKAAPGSRLPEDPALVFDDDRTKVWTDALALQKAGR